MKKLFIIFALLLSACTTTKIVEVPVETIRTEYKDRVLHDSIYVKEHIDTHVRNDTIFKDVYRYKYIQKTDTIIVLKVDSIDRPVYIESIKEVNKLKNWQVVLMIMGGGFIVLLLYKIYKRWM